MIIFLNADYIGYFCGDILIINLKISIMSVTKFNDSTFLVDGRKVVISGKRCRVDDQVIDKYDLAYFMVHLPGCYYKFLHFEVYNSAFTYNEIYDSLKTYLFGVCS